MSGKPCACGCGRFVNGDEEYGSSCRNSCACGCGQRTRYAYARGHRPTQECVRCGIIFAPLASEGGMCSQCRRHVKAGGPLERDGKLITSRKMQAASPKGQRWCSGCERYRSVKYFNQKSDNTYYSRCKPCFRRQHHSSTVTRKYNITPVQYDKIKAVQGGKCAICQRATGASKNLAVDHDHACCNESGSCGECIRGLLCSTCNNILGFARDDPALFQRAIDYLADPPAKGVL